VIEPVFEPEDDITYLLESLEEVLNSGTRVPFTSRTLVDDEKCLEIIDQIKLSLPREIRQARQVNSQREAMMEEARKHSEQLIISAENEARERVKDHYVAREAEARGQELLIQAERRAAQMRADAEQYVYQVLVDLDNRLERLSATVRGGLQTLEPDVASGGGQRTAADQSTDNG
jgi:vacuolar-type H+-ATPase subunit H